MCLLPTKPDLLSTSGLSAGSHQRTGVLTDAPSLLKHPKMLPERLLLGDRRPSGATQWGRGRASVEGGNPPFLPVGLYANGIYSQVSFKSKRAGSKGGNPSYKIQKTGCALLCALRYCRMFHCGVVLLYCDHVYLSPQTLPSLNSLSKMIYAIQYFYIMKYTDFMG